MKNKLKKVYFFSNGMVMAFDEAGEQVPRCQGFMLDRDVTAGLRRHCDESTEFSFGKFRDGQIKCDLRWWFEKRRKKE